MSISSNNIKMSWIYSTKSKLVENLLMFDANLRDKRSSKEVSVALL